jgi:hypothetical protein
MSTDNVTVVNWVSPETGRTGYSSLALELSREATDERYKRYGCAISGGTRRGMFAGFRRLSLERDALHLAVLTARFGGGSYEACTVSAMA